MKLWYRRGRVLATASFALALSACSLKGGMTEAQWYGNSPNRAGYEELLNPHRSTSKPAEASSLNPLLPEGPQPETPGASPLTAFNYGEANQVDLDAIARAGVTTHGDAAATSPDPGKNNLDTELSNGTPYDNATK